MMTCEQWCKLASKVDVQAKIKDCSYSKVYPCLVEHFAKLHNPTWCDAIVALHIVYGWMPTIPGTALRTVPTWECEQRENLLRILERASSGETLTHDDVVSVQSFCNRSVIGASKLLHFLCPGQNPIWDRNVARVFAPELPQNYPALNNVKRWLIFRDRLLECIGDTEVLGIVEELRQLQPDLNNVSALRIVELVLFYARP